MFEEFISLLENVAIQREKDFIKAIPVKMMDDYVILTVYRILVSSKDFNDFDNICCKLRENALRYKQESVKDIIDSLITFSMDFKEDD